MANKTVSDEEFIELWRTLKSAAAVSHRLDIQERAIHARRRRIEAKYGIKLEAKDHRTDLWKNRQTAHETAARHYLGIENGTIIVFSDAHFWPGIRTTAFKGLLWAIKELKPRL
jgi:hypothetical protein